MAMPVAADRKILLAEEWACIVEIEVVVICRKLDMVNMALEASQHVDKEAGPADKTYCMGSCSHCMAVQPVDTADCRDVSYSYRVVCPALPAVDVHSWYQCRLSFHRPMCPRQRRRKMKERLRDQETRRRAVRMA
jgi:hypothetical protein